MIELLVSTLLVLGFIATAVYGFILFKQGNSSLRQLVYDQRRAEQRDRNSASALSRTLSARQRELTRGELLEELTEQAPPRILVQTANDLSVAGWSAIPAPLYLAIEFGSIGLAVIPYLTGHTMFVVISIAIVAPMLISTILKSRVKSRLKQFDADYYAFLLVFVSLVRVGMNTVTALEQAVKHLPPESLVREEIQTVLKVLQLGIPEAIAFSQLGKRFYHPHLISFRNAILVNRRFGGSLSDAVVRIAMQNRKQHNLFDKVDAAIAMERGSIYLITFIMGGLMLFLTLTNPEFNQNVGETATYVIEGGVMLIVLGFIGIQRLSQIRV